MSRPMKLVIGVVAVGLAGGAIFLISRRASAKQDGFTTVAVARGTIVDKALAVGQIVPEQEIQVKSQISGRVKECFVEVGDPVEVGEALFSISPDPTPLELAEADRGVQLAQIGFDKAERDLDRYRSLWQGGVLSRDSYDSRQKDFDQARVALEQEKDRLALLKDGRIVRRVGGVDSVIRASTAGTVLERSVNPGDPVVPITTFQEGTVLMTLADMKTLRFKGTVDEIDVGKLHEGLPVRLQIGALPGNQVLGRLARIAPKARTKEGATVFDVEATIEQTAHITLRAGYSANADIVIEEKQDVLLLPERLVTFEAGKAFVELPAAKPETAPEKKEIQTGLSDGLNVEVVAGLGEGDKVVQRPPKEVK